jgi:hypothetical protein
MFNYHTRNAGAMFARMKAEIDEEFHVLRKLEKIIFLLLVRGSRVHGVHECPQALSFYRFWLL